MLVILFLVLFAFLISPSNANINNPHMLLGGDDCSVLQVSSLAGLPNERIVVALFKHSQMMEAQGCLNESISTMLQMPLNIPGSEHVLFRLGRVELMRGNYQGAMMAFSDCVKLAPRYSESYSYLAFLHLQRKEMETGKRCLTTALAIDPTDILAGSLLLQFKEERIHLQRYLKVLKDAWNSSKIATPGNERNATLVTSFNSLYFRCGVNMIGSVQNVEPNMPIAVFDLGMDPLQKYVLSMLKGVDIYQLDFNKLPKHVRNLRNYAWKPLVLREAAALFGDFFYQDAGQEARKPLAPILNIIRRDGYFYVTQGEKRLGKHTHPDTLRALNIEFRRVELKDMCAGGIQGYRKDSFAIHDVLQPVIDCVLNKYCISPLGADQSNHRFDQSVVSAVLASKNYRCHNNWAFTAYLEMSRFRERDEFDEANGFGYEDPVIFSKRCGQPWPHMPRYKLEFK